MAVSGRNCAAVVRLLDIVPMVRRAAFPALLLAACIVPQTGEPSLAPRAAEAIDPRVPIPSEVVAGPTDPALAATIADLRDQARAGDAAFLEAEVDAVRLTAVAGPAQSEGWVAAQQAVSAMISARAPLTKAMADLDALAAARLAATGGILPGDLAAIQQAQIELSAKAAQQVAPLDRLEARSEER